MSAATAEKSATKATAKTAGTRRTRKTAETKPEVKDEVKAPEAETILDRVEKDQIIKVTLGEIRDEMGHSRIGRKVLASMAEHLSDENLGSFPAWIMNPFENTEPRQWQEVWVYKRDGSAKSAVLDAFSDPDTNDLVAALNMFSEGTPDFKSMDDVTRLAFVRAAVCK